MADSYVRRNAAIDALGEALGYLRSIEELGRDDARKACEAAGKKLYPVREQDRKRFVEEAYDRALIRGEEMW